MHDYKNERYIENPEPMVWSAAVWLFIAALLVTVPDWSEWIERAITPTSQPCLCGSDAERHLRVYVELAP